jgi:hypothetical protein
MSILAIACQPDIKPLGVYAQVEVFLEGLKKPEAISIPCAGGLFRVSPM